VKWLSQNFGSVIDLTAAHLALAVPAIVLSIVIAVPIGWLAQRNAWAREPALAAVGVLYAIPSLPLFVLIPVLLGIGIRSSTNAVIVLTIYGTAIMVRAAADAFASVPTEARLSAVAMGYSAIGRFWAVELPLAVPVMIAGLRVVVVSTIGMVTVASVIGIPSLGTLFTDGFQRGITAEVITGIVVTVVLALALDGACVLAGRIVAPWSTKTARA
jgi:osmoprotectant transport system permease protein